jgi:hypothetical protein
MILKRTVLTTLFISLFLSCSVFLPGSVSFNNAGYEFDYFTFNKTLDYDNKKYLLNSTSINNSGLSSGLSFSYIDDFFDNQLKSNVINVKYLKNNKGKQSIPFLISYDITNEQITFLKNNTDIDYIILTRIQYLEKIDKNTLSSLNKKRFARSVAGAIASVKVLDIKTNTPLIEISCTTDVTNPEERNMYTNVKEFQPKAIHKNSYELGEKAMKKLLKKIR